MNLAREIKKDIYWIGVNDRRTHIFENYWPLPKGVAYNSYIIVDEKVVVIDTIERSKMDDYVENIEQLLNGRKVDYLVINHMEPDHTGAIKALLCHYPDVKIIGNAKTFPMLKNFYGVCENLMEVKEGDSLDLGKHKLNFYMAPMLHWPETMVTFESTEGILFSGDIFGAFGTLDGGIFDDEVDLDYLEEEIADIVAKYDKWSKYDTDKGVVIVFSSMYGNTEKMADIIARFLAEKGIKKIRIHDASKTHPSYIINDIFRYKGVILGSCAYNGNAFPTMETLLFELEHMGVKNHVVAFFGGKAWAGGAMPRFNQFAEKIKWEVVAPSCEACGCPKDEDFETCRNIAYAMADKLDEIC